MKKFLALSLLLASTGFAQEQEQKLVDRLLRPDATLENSAQKRKFVADGASIDKKAHVGTFYFDQNAKPKNFSNTRDYSAREFDSNSFYAGRDRSTFATRSTSSSRTIATATSSQAAKTSDANKKARTREFAGQRPFLARGKSENSVEFQRKNKPMTIDDVRELLNKNK